MKKLSPRTHGVLDYITVLFLLISPQIFGMQGTAASFTIALGIVHLVLTSFTNFPMGIFKIVPFKWHGIIEIIVAITLIGVAFYFKTGGDSVSFYFYIGFSVVLFFVWLVSNYGPSSSLPEIHDV